MFHAFVLAVVVAAGCATESGAPAIDTQADTAAVLDVTSRELALVNAGETDKFMELFATDAIAMPPNEPVVRGAAFGDWVRNFMAQYTISGASYTENDVIVAGDVAIHRFAFSWTVTPKAGGESMNETGKGIHILRRQADGSWKIAQDVWNTDAPPPPMPPPAT
jgi:ketosteroid isomerase-like protein